MNIPAFFNFIIKTISIAVLASGIGLVFSMNAIAQTSSAQTANPGDDPKIVVATLNGAIIYLEEVMRLTEALPEEYRQRPLESYFDNLVDDIIDSRLAAEAGNASGLADDPEVMRQMNIAAQRVLAEAWLGSKLLSLISDDDMKSAYQRFIDDESSRQQIRARHILVAEKSEAEAIIEELKTGADFAELAKTKSIGPSRSDGGDLGFFARGAMVPGFENAAFALESGTFSSLPVQTQFGWHVIFVEDKRLEEPPSFEVLAPQLRQTLISQNLSRLLDDLLNSAVLEKRPFAEIRAEAQKAGQN